MEGLTGKFAMRLLISSSTDPKCNILLKECSVKTQESDVPETTHFPFFRIVWAGFVESYGVHRSTFSSTEEALNDQ